MLPILGPVSKTTFSPALPNERRRGCIGGSTACYLWDVNKHEEAAVKIFQFDDESKWNPFFAECTSAGVKNEARVALLYQKMVDSDMKSESQLFYAAPVVDDELPFIYTCPDIAVRRVGYADHYCQLKWQVTGKDDWSFHTKRCTRGITHGQCECKAVKHSDQLYIEMKASKAAEDHIASASALDRKFAADPKNSCRRIGQKEYFRDADTGETLKAEYIKILQSGWSTWWSEYRPFAIAFYDTWLRWYWEGLRDAESTAAIRRAVTNFNAETKAAAARAEALKASGKFEPEEVQMLIGKSKRKHIDIDELLSLRPGDDADMQKCKQWTAMRHRVASNTRALKDQGVTAVGLKTLTSQISTFVGADTSAVFSRWLLSSAAAASTVCPVGAKRKRVD